MDHLHLWQYPPEGIESLKLKIRTSKIRKMDWVVKKSNREAFRNNEMVPLKLQTLVPVRLRGNLT